VVQGFRRDNLGDWWACKVDVASISSPGISWRPVRVMETYFVAVIVVKKFGLA
jgi:hypothetical protein